MEVPVVLRERRSSSGEGGVHSIGKRTLTISVDSERDTVADVLEKIAAASSFSSDRLQVLLGGCRLQPATPIAQLQLGPATSLLALVAERCKSVEAEEENTVAGRSLRAQGSSSFFVFCKQCKGAKSAKLRVHCSVCDSTSVQVRREPERWSDVLRSGRIEVECYECSATAAATGGESPFLSHARFVFKCIQCSEPAAALQHLRLPTVAAAAATSAGPCCICFSAMDDDDSSSSPLFDLRCGHLLCVPCFTELVKTGLKSAQFSLHPVYGYTISCPWPTCKAVVRDPHHFSLAGTDVYSDYKMRALEAFMTEDGVRCAHCAIPFIWEPPQGTDAVISAASNVGSEEKDGGEKTRLMIDCPHCSKQFCAECRREPCTCEDEEAANKVMLEATTRPCPRCGARTERTGGCAHMRCTACGEHWCFVCIGDWTEECQWNHWFS